MSDRASSFLADLPYTAHQHFTLYFYAALLRLLDQASRHFGSAEAADERFPFLAGYFSEVSACLEGASFPEAHTRWQRGVSEWERVAPDPMPLSALRTATGLSQTDLTILAEIGLPDEDPRFGLVFDVLQGGGGERRATLGLLGAGWQSEPSADARASAHRLASLGLVETVPADGGGLRPSAVVWDAVRGGGLIAPGGWVRHRPSTTLPALDTLVLPAELRAACLKLPDVLASGAASAVILRGPRHNGRATLGAALAQSMGKGVLEVAPLDGPGDPRWRSAATLACLAGAAIVTRAEPGPSEAFELPDLPAALAPLFVTLGTAGGLTGSLADQAITLRVAIPDREGRDRLWRTALGTDPSGLGYLRITSGNIVRAAKVAQAGSAVNGNGVDSDALRAAVRKLERPGLEALARRVEPASDWSHLAVSAETLVELTTLAARCRQRERLASFLGAAFDDLGPGVRVLFKGPSGTGKTLAARMLAGVLGMDLYRLDLAAVVNKYIGETEKNLERVFARAEELDIILLLDEGDALLTERTGVHSSNDRYANLETNYLLQRLESYEGILVVTTNAPDRIDPAFQRRMDVVIDFALPEPGERWTIWQLHLPPDHEIEMERLSSAAHRCALSGGQIRNVALHASLLAAESESRVTWDHLEGAIEREYRKQGAMSPLRARNGVR